MFFFYFTKFAALTSNWLSVRIFTVFALAGFGNFFPDCFFKYFGYCPNFISSAADTKKFHAIPIEFLKLTFGRTPKPSLSVKSRELSLSG